MITLSRIDQKSLPASGPAIAVWPVKNPVTVKRGRVGSPWILKFEPRSPSDDVGLLTRPPYWRVYVNFNWLIIVGLTVQVSPAFRLCCFHLKSRSTHGMFPDPDIGWVSVPVR